MVSTEDEDKFFEWLKPLFAAPPNPKEPIICYFDGRWWCGPMDALRPMTDTEAREFLKLEDDEPLWVER